MTNKSQVIRPSRSPPLPSPSPLLNKYGSSFLFFYQTHYMLIWFIKPLPSPRFPGEKHKMMFFVEKYKLHSK